jgi:hypothetical protein
LTATFRQGVLVFVAQSCLGLGLSFTGGHRDIVVGKHARCNPPTHLQQVEYTMTTSWNVQKTNRGTQ